MHPCQLILKCLNSQVRVQKVDDLVFWNEGSYGSNEAGLNCFIAYTLIFLLFLSSFPLLCGFM